MDKMMSLDEVMHVTDENLEKIEQVKPRFHSKNPLFSVSRPPTLEEATGWVPSQSTIGAKPGVGRSLSASRASKRDGNGDVTSNNTKLNQQSTASLYASTNSLPTGMGTKSDLYADRKIDLLTKKMRYIDDHLKGLEKQNKETQQRVQEMQAIQDRSVEGHKQDRKALQSLKESFGQVKMKIDLLMNSEEVREKLNHHSTFGYSTQPNLNNVNTALLDPSYLEEFIQAKIQSSLTHTIEEIVSKHEKLQQSRQFTTTTAAAQNLQKQNQQYFIDQITLLEKEVLKQKNELSSVKSKQSYLDSIYNELKSSVSVKELEQQEAHKKQLKNYRLEFNTLLTQTQEQIDNKLLPYQSQAQEIAEQKEQLDNALTRFGDCFSNFDIKLTQLEQELLGQSNLMTKYKNNEFLPLQRRVEEVEHQQQGVQQQLEILHTLREDVQLQYDTQLVHNSKIILLEKEVSQLTEMMQTNTNNFQLLSQTIDQFPAKWEGSIAEVSRTMQEFHQTYQQSQEILMKSQKKLKTKVNDIITNLQNLMDMKQTMTTLIRELENRFLEEIAHSYDFQSNLQRNSDLLQHLEDRMKSLEVQTHEKIQKEYEELLVVQKKELEQGLQMLQETMEKRMNVTKEALDYRLQSVLVDKEGFYEKVSQDSHRLQQEIEQFKRDQEEAQSNWTSQLLKDHQDALQSHWQLLKDHQMHFQSKLQEWQEEHQEQKDSQTENTEEKIQLLTTDVKSLAETVTFFNQAFATMESQIRIIEGNYHHSNEQLQSWQRELGSLQREIRLQDDVLRRSLVSFEEMMEERLAKEVAVDREAKWKKTDKTKSMKKNKHHHDYHNEDYSETESDSEDSHSSASESDDDEEDHYYPKKHQASSPKFHSKEKKEHYHRDYVDSKRSSRHSRDRNDEEDRPSRRTSRDHQLRSRHDRKKNDRRGRYENEEEEPQNYRYRKHRDDDDDNNDDGYSPKDSRHGRNRQSHEKTRSSRDRSSPKHEKERHSRDTYRESQEDSRDYSTMKTRDSADRMEMPPKPPTSNHQSKQKRSPSLDSKDQKLSSKESSPKTEEWLGINSDHSYHDSQRRHERRQEDRQQKIPDRSRGSDSNPTAQKSESEERLDEVSGEEEGGDDSDEDDRRSHAIDPHPPPIESPEFYRQNNDSHLNVNQEESEEYVQTPSPTDFSSQKRRNDSDEMVLIAPSTADRTGLDTSPLVSEAEGNAEAEEKEEGEISSEEPSPVEDGKEEEEAELLVVTNENETTGFDQSDEEKEHVAPTFSTSPTQRYSPNTLLAQKARTNRANVPGGVLKALPPVSHPRPAVRPPGRHPSSLQFPAEIRRSEAEHPSQSTFTSDGGRVRGGVTDHSISENLLNHSSTGNDFLPTYETYPPTSSTTSITGPLLETSLVTSSTSPLDRTVVPLSGKESEIAVEEETAENHDFRKVHELMDSTYSSIVALDLKSIKHQSFEDFYHDPAIVRSPLRTISSSASDIFPTIVNRDSNSDPSQKDLTQSMMASMFPVVSEDQLVNEQKKPIDEEDIVEGEDFVSPSVAVASDASVMNMDDKREDETIITSDSQIRQEDLQRNYHSRTPTSTLVSPLIPPLSSTSSTASSSSEKKSTSHSSTQSTASSSPPDNLPASPPNYSLNDLATISIKELNNSLEYYDREEDPFMIELQKTGQSPENPVPVMDEAEEDEDSASDDSLDHLPKYSPKDLNQMHQTETLEREELEGGNTRMEGLDILSEFESLLNRSNRSHSSPSQGMDRQMRDQVEAIDIPADAFEESDGGSQRSFEQYIDHDVPPGRDEPEEVIPDNIVLPQHYNNDLSTPTMPPRPPLPHLSSHSKRSSTQPILEASPPPSSTGDRSSFLLLDDYDQEVEEIKEYLSSDLLGGTASTASSIEFDPQRVLEERRKAEILAEKKKKYRSEFMAKLKKK